MAVMNSAQQAPGTRDRSRAGRMRGRQARRANGLDELFETLSEGRNMDRVTQEFLLAEVTADQCDPMALDQQPGADTVPSPQERLARIVRTIETDIIPRLVRAHRPEAVAAEAVTVEGPGAQDVSEFARLMLAADDAGTQALLERLLRRGVAVDELYLGLMAPAAVELGRRWDEDLVPFTDVTVALGRMQRLLRSLSPSFEHGLERPSDGRRVLLLPAPGEQHTFGLSIVAEFFRRASWEVVGDSASPTEDPARLVRDEWFDVVGISVGLESRLDWLKSGIAAMRAASRNRAIGVLVGGPSFVHHPERAFEVGADGTACDGRQAPLVAERLLQERPARL